MDMKTAHRLFSVGDVVVVKDDISTTHRIYTAVDHMRELIGHEITVNSVHLSSGHGEPCISAGGWSWHPNDLYVVKHANPGKLEIDGPHGVFKFDTKNL